MAFPLLKLLPGILKTIGRISGLPLGDAAASLEKAEFTPEQQLALQEALQRHEAAMKQLSVDELRAVIQENIVATQNEDKYVRRARPTGLYAFYGICTATAIALLVGIKIDPVAILTLTLPMAGVGGTYVYNRTREKLKNGNGTE